MTNKTNKIERELKQALKGAPMPNSSEIPVPLHTFLQETIRPALLKLYNQDAQPFVLIYYTNMEIAHSNGLVPRERRKQDYERVLYNTIYDMTRMFNTMRNGGTGYLMIASFTNPGNLDLTSKANIIDAFLSNPHTCYIEIADRGSIRRNDRRKGRAFSTQYVSTSVFHTHDNPDNHKFIYGLREITDTLQSLPEKREYAEDIAAAKERENDPTVPVTIGDLKERMKSTYKYVNSLVTTNGVTSVVRSNVGGSIVEKPFSDYFKEFWDGYYAAIKELREKFASGEIVDGEARADFLHYDVKEDAITFFLSKFTTGDSDEKFGTQNAAEIFQAVLQSGVPSEEVVDVLFDNTDASEDVLEFFAERYKLHFPDDEVVEDNTVTETAETVNVPETIEGN